MLQAGGGAAREAVAELGEAVTAGIRRASVLPTAVLLVAALFADRHLPASSAALPAAGHGGGKPANGAAYEVAASAAAAASPGRGSSGGAGHGGTPVPAALACMDWLAAELEQHGAAVVRLPQRPGSFASAASSGSSSAEEGERVRERLLLHAAGMLASCCSVSRSSGAGRQQVRLRLERGAQATLLQHSRLNQLLPWLAAEGLLVAALLGAQARQSGCAGGGLATAGGAAAGSVAVGEPEVLESAAWLRCMLAPEVDTGKGVQRGLVGRPRRAHVILKEDLSAEEYLFDMRSLGPLFLRFLPSAALGPGALRSLRDFEPALHRLLASGVLERPALGTLRLARGSSEGAAAHRTALLAAALLAPLLATYSEAARAMAAVLTAAGPSRAASRELCGAAQARLLDLAAANCGASSSAGGRAASLVVPSTALVQGALRSLAADRKSVV